MRCTKLDLYESAAVAVILVLMISGQAFSEEPPTPGSTDLPVTKERLTGARLVYHRSHPKLAWSFGKDAFVLEIGGEAAPLDLIETLTGTRRGVARIEGFWRLNEDEGSLALSIVAVDGEAIRRKARLPISPAGLVRVDLGEYQYNVFPGESDLGKREPKLTFRQLGQNLVVTMVIEIPDAPHVVWTHAERVMDHDPYLEGPRRPPRLDWIELMYYVIQCRDDPILVHSRHRTKSVEVSWRLAGLQKSDVPFRVVNRFNPSAAELTELSSELKRIADETRDRAPLAVP